MAIAKRNVRAETGDTIVSENGDKDKKTFVNRHGHRADMNRIDLSDISVESDGEVHHISPATVEPKKARERQRITIKWNKRSVLIIAGVLVLLLILPIAAGEIIAVNYRAGAAGVDNKLNKFITDKVLPSQKQTTIKSSSIAEITAGVDVIRSETCAGGFTDNLSKLYPRAKSAHDDCIKKSGQLSDLSASLRKLESENRYVESILSATKTVATPLTEPFAVIDAQQTNWVAARDAVKKLTPPAQWQSQHKELLDWIAKVADGWTALNAASGAQDKAKFELAEKDLNAGYEGIRNTVDGLGASLHTTQSAITTARKAF